MAEDRPCPVCGRSGGALFMKERLNPDACGRMTYASRKNPEFMCHRLLRCPDCDVVYAANPPSDDFLEEAYGDADYDSRTEAVFAAGTYGQALSGQLGDLPRGCALDVGAGDGAMLERYLDMGFASAAGVEPSGAAIAAAADAVRPLLRHGLFSRELADGLRPNLISSFMTLEHLRDPGDFARTAYELLEPGGMMAVVVHNWRGLLNRMLGGWSPIIDIEHLQLFSPKSVRTLLELAGYRDVKVVHLRNRYPLAYWLRLTPLPAGVKNALSKMVRNWRLAPAFNVGNIMTLGTKP